MNSAKMVKTNLQAVRKAAGFQSARAFAEHIGMSVNTYTGYEQGKPMSLEVAWSFADALNCSLDDLAGRPRPKMMYSDHRQTALNDCFNALNDKGRERLVEEAEMLAENKKFAKSETEDHKVSKSA